MNKAICVIPARRGSKRLKLKNILEVNGKPVIAYSIIAALESKKFEHVYVATEDPEIAEIARKYGAKVPVLVPKKLAGDLIPSWAPCVYISDFLKKTSGEDYDTLVCLQPSSVLKESQDIVSGMDAYEKGGHSFLVSVTPIDPHYFHWAVIDDAGKWRMYFRKKYLMERPLLPPVYRPNGAIKIANIEKLKKYKFFFGRNLGVVMMPEERSMSITVAEDLKIADFMLRNKNKR